MVEKRAFKRNLTDMADWVYEFDRTDGSAGDLTEEFPGNLTGDDTTGVEDSPSFFVNSIFSEIADVKIGDIKVPLVQFIPLHCHTHKTEVLPL